VIAIDTNVLLRTLLDVDSDDHHSAPARLFVDAAGKVRIAEIIFVEALWVLRKRFQATRAEAITFGRSVLDHTCFCVEGASRFREALKVYEGTNIDFTDAVPLIDARTVECPLHTFDRKLSRLQGASSIFVR
jgi:predicted nucleic-acid-binding protein